MIDTNELQLLRSDLMSLFFTKSGPKISFEYNLKIKLHIFPISTILRVLYFYSNFYILSSSAHVQITHHRFTQNIKPIKTKNFFLLHKRLTIFVSRFRIKFPIEMNLVRKTLAKRKKHLVK